MRVTGVNVKGFAGDSRREVRAEKRGGIPDVVGRDIALERRDLLHVVQHLAKSRDASGGERLDRARRDRVYADVPRTEVGREEADVGFEARLGEAHDVVGGY